MTPSPQLQSLRERLATASGPDRKIDALIAETLDGRELEPDLTEQPHWRWTWTSKDGSRTRGGWSVAIPHYTASLDAAVALVERVLPGWTWRVASCCVSDDAWVMPDFNDPVHGERLKAEWPEACQRDPLEYLGTDIDLRPSGRPAIALCISVVTALTARGDA